MSELSFLEQAGDGPAIDWNKILRVMQTTPTLQVVVNPKLRRGSTIHDRAFDELRKLGADYVRFVPWFPYPRNAIAELYPPAHGKTHWDFTSIDPFVIDFLEATKDHPVMLNFSTIPPWMFKVDQLVPYPEDPDQPIWDYQIGTELRDPSLKELGDYFARLVSWYTKGGFEDEYGHYHESGHHYKIDYWEVLNEADFEHGMTPEQYTERYDTIVSAIRNVAPDMKFVGLGLAMPSRSPEYFEHFLNLKNHKAGIPLDMISYHFYAMLSPDEATEITQQTCFAQADGFLNTVRYVENMRQRLSPTTGTTLNELGAIRADDLLQFAPGHMAAPIPDVFWNLSGAVFAYLFAQLSVIGIDIAGQSQLVGYPTQFPSVTMVDWNTGASNARYRVLELLITHFKPGSKVINTSTGFFPSPLYHAQAYCELDGTRKLLLVSKRDREMTLMLKGCAGATVQVIDQASAGGPARIEKLGADRYNLPAFGVAVLTLPQA